MAYCRGGDDSDVYVLSVIPHNDANLYATITAVDNRDQWWVHISNKVNYHTEFYAAYSLEELHTLLLYLRAQGLKVPQYALDRIQEEIDIS
tara:strand:+ start:3068 stop:3340 length:273 start_codon:yes stop_codon:yes gene_type:complete